MTDGKIVPGTLAVGGMLGAAFDIDPEKFPEGIDMTLTRPGALEVLGVERLKRGAMLLYVPPESAVHLRAMVKATPAPTPGNGPSLDVWKARNTT